MRDLATLNAARVGDEPFAVAELVVIGVAWKGASFSMRSLKQIVSASLEAATTTQ